MFAGTNFLINIFLARWLTPLQYGAFVLSYSSFLVLGIIHTSIITEPMLVFGSITTTKNAQYFRIVKNFHWKVTLLFTLILLSAMAIIRLTGSTELGSAVTGLTLSAPFILLLWLSRRIFYVVRSPKYSAAGGIFYGISSMLLLYSVFRLGLLNTFTAYLVFGLASLVVSIILNFFLKQEKDNSVVNQVRIISDHLRYGKWIIPSALLSWVPGNAIYFLLSTWGNLGDSAAFRALMNLQMPVLHINTAIGILIVPYLSKTIQSHDERKFKRRTGIAIIFFITFASLFILLLYIFKARIFDIFYAGKFAESMNLVSILSISLLFTSVSTVLGNALRSIQALRRIFQIALVTAILSLAAGFWLVPIWGVGGAVMTILISSVVEASLIISIFLLETKKMRVV